MIRTNYITDENKVLDLISSVKMVVVPSRIDNYPNICLESLKCKVPVVAFSIRQSNACARKTVHEVSYLHCMTQVHAFVENARTQQRYKYYNK